MYMAQVTNTCKAHYIDCLMIELHLHSSLGNPIYTATTLSKEEIIDNRHILKCWSINICIGYCTYFLHY
jgi:hypothetical protein